jgi:hypothetical protein
LEGKKLKEGEKEWERGWNRNPLCFFFNPIIASCLVCFYSLSISVLIRWEGEREYILGSRKVSARESLMRDGFYGWWLD